MNDKMKRNTTTPLVLAIVIVVAVISIVAVAAIYATVTPGFLGPPFQRRVPPSEANSLDLQLFYTVETVVSTINVMLSAILLTIYISIYRKTNSEFTLGLIIFSAVLLLHAFVSIPVLFRYFGFYASGLGPFAMLPDIFTCIALIILLYLTFKY